MEGKIYELIEVWISIFISIRYCYIISRITSKGITRFICVLPIVFIFLLLPLHVSSVQFSTITGLFISWLANFKLLLFAFGKGPLCSYPSIPFPHFLAVACFPIKIKQIQKYPDSNLNKKSTKNPKFVLDYALKGLIFAILLHSYTYTDHIHPKISSFVLIFHISFLIQIILTIATAIAETLTGLELEPQFNNPLLSTSPREFWGRRWNLMVTGILRPTVYNPMVDMFTYFVDRRWAKVPAVFATFFVSAMMHEILMYYTGRMAPTWDVTRFFLLQGGFLMAEFAFQNVVTVKFELPKCIYVPVTLGFLIMTVDWLYLPQLLRCMAHIRGIEEYEAVGVFFREIYWHVSKYVFQTK